MSNTWVPALKPPHPSSIPVISELAQRIINALTLETEQEVKEMSRLYGKPYNDKKEFQADRLLFKECVNVFNNELQNNAGQDCEGEMKEDDINVLFNYTGSFSPSLESLTPDFVENDNINLNLNRNNVENNFNNKANERLSFIFRERTSQKLNATPRCTGSFLSSLQSLTLNLVENDAINININRNNAENNININQPISMIFRDGTNQKLKAPNGTGSLQPLTPDLFENDISVNKNRNNAENIFNDKANGPIFFLGREKTSKKLVTTPRKILTVKKKHQTTIDRYFKNIKKPDLNIPEKENNKKSSKSENNIIISETRESVNWETSDKGKTEGNHNEKYSNLSKAFIFAQPETAIRKRHLDANEVCGTGTMQRSDNSIKRMKKYIRPLKTFQKRQSTLEDYIRN